MPAGTATHRRSEPGSRSRTSRNEDRRSLPAHNRAALLNDAVRDGAPEPAERQLRGSSGVPLDGDALDFMQERFGYDFSTVLVHPESQSAVEMNAAAYTVGRDIVFAPGQFNPSSRTGRQLLAHELAHVVQQSRGGPAPAPLPGSSLEQSAGSAASAAMNAGSGTVGVAGSSGAGVAREPLSLNTTIQPSALSDKELQHEHFEVQTWLSKNWNTNDPQKEHMLKSLNRFEAEVARRDKARKGPRDPLLPFAKGGGGKDDLVKAMRSVDSIVASSAGNGYTILYDDERVDITSQQAEVVRKKAGGALRDNLNRVNNIRESAVSGYRGQQAVDAKHWIVAPIVKTLGGVKDPGPSLLGFAGTAAAKIASARELIENGQFASAAQAFADAEVAARQAEKMWQAYFQGIISAGEMTITVLEVTRDVAFITLAVLATVATAGAASGAIGATTTAFGVEVGTAATASFIATAAPIAATVGTTIYQVAMGDKVDWGMVVVDIAISLLLAKFGGSVGKGVARAAAQQIGKKIASEVAKTAIERAIHAIILHEGATVLRTTAEAVVKTFKGQEVTWQQFLDTLIARMIDPKGIAVAAVVSAVSTAAEVKYSAPTSGAGTTLGGNEPSVKPAGSPAPEAKAPESAAKPAPVKEPPPKIEQPAAAPAVKEVPSSPPAAEAKPSAAPKVEAPEPANAKPPEPSPKTPDKQPAAVAKEVTAKAAEPPPKPAPPPAEKTPEAPKPAAPQPGDQPPAAGKKPEESLQKPPEAPQPGAPAAALKEPPAKAPADKPSTPADGKPQVKPAEPNPAPPAAENEPATPAPTAAPKAAEGKGIADKEPTGPSFGDVTEDLKQVPEGKGELKGTGSAEDFKVQPIPKGEKPNVTVTDPTTKVKTKVSIVESENASPKATEYYGEGGPEGVYKSGSAQTKRSLTTGIKADVGESQTYKRDLMNGEIGLRRPLGSNIPGADYITARRGPDGKIRIYAKDAKSSIRGKFPKPDPKLKTTWRDAVRDAVDGLKENDPGLADPNLVKEIKAAFADGRVSKEQVNIDYSPAGQGKITTPK
jgi:hypothetical protein